MIDLSRFDNSGFERGAPLWKEAAWIAVKLMFFLPPWPLPSALRVALLRIFGAKVGDGVVIRSRVNVTFPWRLTLGDHVWIGEEVLILTLAPVTIEDHVCVSQRAFLCTGSHRFDVPTFDLVAKPITVRKSSWIAAGAFIAAGVEVGEGSLVTAHSVVLESVAPRSIVRGNPACFVKVAE